MAFGEKSKWNASAKIIQVDISAKEIGRNAGTAELGVVGNIKLVVPNLLQHLSGWRWDASPVPFLKQIKIAKEKNEVKAVALVKKDTVPLNYERTIEVIKTTLHSLSPPEEGKICHVSEGSI